MNQPLQTARACSIHVAPAREYSESCDENCSSFSLAVDSALSRAGAQRAQSLLCCPAGPEKRRTLMLQSALLATSITQGQNQGWGESLRVPPETLPAELFSAFLAAAGLSVCTTPTQSSGGERPARREGKDIPVTRKVN